MKCLSVELENLTGQDMWRVRSICWGGGGGKVDGDVGGGGG